MMEWTLEYVEVVREQWKDALRLPHNGDNPPNRVDGLLDLIVDNNIRCDTVVDVGTGFGSSAKLFSQFFNRIITIDNFTEFDTYKYNSLSVDNISIIRNNSIDAAKIFADEKKQFGFVYIDADHAYESIHNDIHAWLPLVEKGGVLAGHDCDHYHQGVVKAVQELLYVSNGKTVKLYRDSSWAFIV